MKKLFSLGIVLFMLSGCATNIAMSKKIITETGVENTTEFQYYVSKTITLTLVESDASTTIKDGQLIRKSNTARNKITITGNLPGVVRRHERLSENAGYLLDVAFENLDDNPTLSFGPSGQSGDRYVLYYNDPENDIVIYGGNRYKVSYASGNPRKILGLKLGKTTHQGQPYLLIKAKQNHKKTEKSRRAKGVKLGD